MQKHFSTIRGTGSEPVIFLPGTGWPASIGAWEGSSSKVQKKFKRQTSKLKKSGISVCELTGGHYAPFTDKKAAPIIRAFLTDKAWDAAVAGD